MKRYILLIACFISILVSLEASAANVTKVVITTREPMVGEKQSFQALNLYSLQPQNSYR